MHPLIMALHQEESFIFHAVHTTTFRICQPIRDDQLMACNDVKDYISRSEEHQVMSTMIRTWQLLLRGSATCPA